MSDMQPQTNLLTAQQLAETDVRKRADRLRRALRTNSCTTPNATDAATWIEIFDLSDDAGLRVLLLEHLAPLHDPRITEMAQRGMTSRGDGVRLECMRILVERDPRGLRALCELFEDDDSVEVRLLLATRLFRDDAVAATDRLLKLLESEAGGFRERHALERVLEFFIDEQAPVAEALRSMQPDFDDPEEYFAWAFERLP
jgi:hypothetical protein